MDLRHGLHKTSRVDFPISLQFREAVRQALRALARHLPPTALTLFGFAGFIGCGVAVIATATLVALQIH